jgi:hypothetical protein
MPDSSQNPSPQPLVPAASRKSGSGVSRKSGSGVSRKAACRRPLPDAHAVRTRLVPDAAPPYDDATTAAACAQREAPAVRPAKVAIVVQAEDSPDEQARFTRQAGRAQPAVPGRWPSQFAQILAETLAGSRPVRQIRPWTTEQARKRIDELGPMLSAARQPRVRRVIVTSPAQGVLEMTVIVDFGTRARAMAVRLERPPAPSPRSIGDRQPDITAHRPQLSPATNWLCTAIEAA